jgi:hypothetical protein
MPDPCIKGSAFVGVVDDLNRLLDEGRTTREALEERLQPDDLAYLDEDEVAPGFWYPMPSYDRLLSVLVELEGGDDPRAYLLGRGEAAMKRMMALGLYNQFASLEQGWTRLAGRVLGTISQVVYNFMTFEIVSGADAAGDGTQSSRFTILVRDGGLLSRNAQTTIEGAVAALASRAAHGPVTVSARRVSTDEVEIYVEREVA